MRRLLALGIVLGVAWLVRRMGAGESELRATALALGFALIAAALAGSLFERLRLPRVSGYLVFGLACGPYVANIISGPMARELQLVNGLAIAIIAFIAGLELNLQRLLPRLPAIFRLGGATIVLMNGALVAVLWTAWPWLPLAPELTGVARLALAILLAILVVSFSPTVTIAIIAESRARGPLSELVLAVVVIADLGLILLFTFAMQFVRWALGDTLEAADAGLLARLSWEILGSFAFGAGLGALFAFYLQIVGRELTLVLLALCSIVSVGGAAMHLEPLLAALAAGLVVENIAPPSGDALKEAVERGALPVLVIFFAAAGASLYLDALATLGVTALVIALMRLGLARAATHLGVRWAGIEASIGDLVWMGLVSQAGVTIGLTVIVAAEFPAWGVPLQTLIVALTALHVLVGPVLFRAALARAGEIGRMDAA